METLVRNIPLKSGPLSPRAWGLASLKQLSTEELQQFNNTTI